MAASKRAGRGARNYRQWIVDTIFGFDYFISYSRRDGQVYAAALAERLRREHDFVCFLDTDDFELGPELSKATERAIARSSSLIVVLSPLATESIHVRNEVALFKDRLERVVPIFPLDMTEQRLADSPLGELVSPSALHIKEAVTAQSEPTPRTTSELARSFSLLRQTRKRLFAVLTAAGLLAASSAVAIVMAVRANERAERLRTAAISISAASASDPAQALALVAELDPEVVSAEAVRAGNDALAQALPTAIVSTSAGVVALGEGPAGELVIVDEEGRVQWRTAGGAVTAVQVPDVMQGYGLGCRGQVSADGQLAIVMRSDGAAYRVSAQGACPLQSEYPLVAARLAVSSDKARIAAAADGRLIVWDAPCTRAAKKLIGAELPAQTAAPALGFNFEIAKDYTWAVTFVGDAEQTLWSGHQDGIRAWRVADDSPPQFVALAGPTTDFACYGKLCAAMGPQRITILDSESLAQLAEVETREGFTDLEILSVKSRLGLVTLDRAGEVAWRGLGADGKLEPPTVLGVHRDSTRLAAVAESFITYGGDSAWQWTAPSIESAGLLPSLHRELRGQDGLIEAALISAQEVVTTGSSKGGIRRWASPAAVRSRSGRVNRSSLASLSASALVQVPMPTAVSVAGSVVIGGRYFIDEAGEVYTLQDAVPADGKSVHEAAPPSTGWSSPAVGDLVAGNAISADARTVAVAGSQGLFLYRVDTPHVAGLKFAAPTTTLHEWLAVSFVDEDVFAVRRDGKLARFSLAGQENGQLTLQGAHQLLRAFFVGSQRVAALSADNECQVYRIDTGKPEGGFTLTAEEAIGALALTHDGQRLATSRDKQVVVRRRGGSTLARLEQHAERVTALAFSPDGRWLASGGDDRRVVVSDGEGVIDDVTFFHDEPVAELVFSSADRLLVVTRAAGQAPVIYEWDLSLERLVTTARAKSRYCLAASLREQTLGESRREARARAAACLPPHDDPKHQRALSD